MRLTRVTRLLPLVLLAGPLLLVGAGATPASAQAGDVIQSFDSRIAINDQGDFHVREEIVYRFGGGSDRHGIYRYIPVEFDVEDDTDHLRVTEVSNVRVTSPTGAPANVEKKVTDRNLVIRVGDEDRTVSGTETYVIDYDVSGAMNSFDDHEELYWNVTGNGWDAPMLAVTSTVSAPVAPVDTFCAEGASGSKRPCASEARVGSTNAVRFVADPLGPNEQLTVGLAYPKGSIAVAPPVLRERWTVEKAFSVGTVPLGAAVLTLLGGLFAVGYVVWSRGRDRRYVGQIPGLLPAGGADGPDERKPLVGGPGVTVDFAPAKDLRPGEAGTLIDESADVLDVTATIIDLAVRRYLKIEEIGEKKLFFTKRDWTLTKLKDADAALKPYERTLFNALFKGRDAVDLSQLKRTFADDLAAVQKQLYTQVVTNGWFRRRPDSTRASWSAWGLVIAGLGAGLTYVLARWTHFGLVGIAAVFAGLALLWAGRYMPAKTAKGSAALAQVLGFRQYIRTAEAEQIRFEEREDVFSRYLPYAIIFGETERWAKTFASLAAGAAVGGAASQGFSGLYWYGALGAHGFDDFTDSLSSFTTSTAGSIAAAAPSSSSGFSGGGGGFSGGGFGGGGGGSW